MHVLLWPRMQSSLFDPRVYHQGIPALVEEMLCALAFRGLWAWGSFLPCVNRPVVGLGTDDDFSLLASACRGHLVACVFAWRERLRSSLSGSGGGSCP